MDNIYSIFRDKLLLLGEHVFRDKLLLIGEHILLCRLATNMVDDKIVNEEQMYLLCWQFQWPCKHMGARLLVSPNAACPGLHRKPLDAIIGQLLALYCPSGCQGNSK
jgi:hypothetical protein